MGRPSSETRWRTTAELVVSLLVGALLLVCLGLLLGAAWTTQAFHHQHRLLAQERCRLYEEWLAIHIARCPHRKRGGC